MENKQVKDENKSLSQTAFIGASAKTVQRYGSAVKEHLVSYNGIDNETGTILTKSLKSISESNVHPDYVSQNLKQQSGFSAEVKESARSNAERIINGDATRKVRADDLGRVNDQLCDFYEIDGSGLIIDGSGTQMKFVGNNPSEAFDKFLSSKYDKYFDNNIGMEVPSDYYEPMCIEADRRLEDLREQLNYQKGKGNTTQIDSIEKKIAKVKKVKGSLQKSSVSSKDAMFARLHPGLSAAKDIVSVSNRAAIQGAEMGAMIGGGVSIIQNFVSVCKGEISTDEAAVNVAKQTAVSAASGYGITFASTALKGAMQNSTSLVIRELSKTNLPTAVVTVVTTTCTSLGLYFAGEISGTECFERIGRDGFGMISSAAFSALGSGAAAVLGSSTAASMMGGILGGVVGYAAAAFCYNVILTNTKNAKIAHEERLRIEKMCEEHIQLLREYRKEVEEKTERYMVSYMTVFDSSFDGIKKALDLGDIDGFILNANRITESLGGTSQFSNMAEFDQLMNSKTTFKL